MEVLIDMDSRYDFFGDEGNCFFEVGFLSVKSTYRGRGIGTALVTESAKLAETMKLVNGNGNSTIDLYSDAEEYKNSRALKMAPACVAAIFTSRFSQECGRRSGFVEVVKVSYTEFVYKGKKFSEITGADHPFCKLAVKVLP